MDRAPEYQHQWEEFGQNVLSALNNVRCNPRNFNRILSEQEGNFDSSNNFVPSGRGGLQIRTKEGVKAHKELMEALDSAQGGHKLSKSAGLTTIAQDFANTVSAMGSVDSSNLVKQIKNQGKMTGRVYFFYQFCYSANPNDIIASILTCDGDKERSNRKYLLGDDYAQIGIGVGNSAASKQFIVLFILTEDFADNGSNSTIEYPTSELTDLTSDDQESNQRLSQDTQWTRMVSDIYQEQNNARTDPSGFAKRLEQQLQYFEDTLLKLPGQIPLKTKEGKEAVLEAIQFLENQTPLAPFKMINGLSCASQGHAEDIGPKGICGHEGSDGSAPADRMARHGHIQGYSAENISFGEQTGFGVVAQLIVDDGVPSRGHRKNLFNDHLTMGGVGVASHKKYGNCVVLNYTGNFFDDSASGVQYPKI